MPHFRTLLVFLALAVSAKADDWPQWLGPRRDGSTTEKIAPWKEAPKVAWRMPKVTRAELKAFYRSAGFTPVLSVAIPPSAGPPVARPDARGQNALRPQGANPKE